MEASALSVAFTLLATSAGWINMKAGDRWLKTFTITLVAFGYIGAALTLLLTYL